MGRFDAHQHFWAYNETEYGWMGRDDSPLKQDRMPDDLAPLLEASSVDGTVAVQAREMTEETDFLLGLADRHSFIRAVVGWGEMTSPDFEKELDRVADRPKLRGYRYVLQSIANTEFMLRDDFKRGIAALGPRGLTYDLLILPRHLRPAVELVDAFPDLPFVVDHLAKPMIRGGEIEPWATDLRRLAEREHVWLKVSGMVSEGPREGADLDRYRPYLDVVFGAFGVERLMVGSDWPVCTAVASYADTIAVADAYLADLSAHERATVWNGAARFYGFEDSSE